MCIRDRYGQQHVAALRGTERAALNLLRGDVLLTIPVAVGMTFLEVKAGQKDLIPTKYETARTLEEVDRLFGGTTNEYLMVESDALLTYPMIKKFMLLEGEMVEALGEDDYVYMQHYLSAFGPNMLDQARQRAMEDYGINEEEAQLILADVPTLFKLGEGMMQEDPFNPGVVKPFEQIIEEGVDFFLANPVGYKWTVEKKGAGLFSEDGRYAKILIKVDPALDSSQRKAYATRVEEFFRSYFGAIVFAWLGNVAYTFTSHDTLLGFWSRLPVASGLILFTVAHATRRYGMRGMLAYFGEVLTGAALATLLTMVPAGLVAIHRASRILGKVVAVRRPGSNSQTPGTAWL